MTLFLAVAAAMGATLLLHMAYLGYMRRPGEPIGTLATVPLPSPPGSLLVKATYKGAVRPLRPFAMGASFPRGHITVTHKKILITGGGESLIDRTRPATVELVGDRGIRFRFEDTPRDDLIFFTPSRDAVISSLCDYGWLERP